MEQRLDLARLLEASQDAAGTFPDAVVAALEDVLGDAKIIVALSDIDGATYRVKASSGFADGQLPSEVPRAPAEEPALTVGEFATSDSPPRALASVFGVDDRVTTIYIDLGPPRLEQYPVTEVSSPKLIILVASPRSDVIRDDVTRFAPFLGRLYVGALDERRLAIRSQLVRQATRSRDVGSVLRRACGLVVELFGFAAAATFVPNERIDTLVLRAITPRRRDVEQYGNYPVRRPNEGPDALWDSFLSGMSAIIKAEDLPATARRLAGEDWGQVLVLPLTSGDSSEHGDVQGIMLCARKASPASARSTTFLWEDLFLLEFYSDILAILIQMLRAQDEAAFHVERVLHGAKTLLSSIRANLTLIDEQHVERYLRTQLQYLLPDSIALIDDLSSQIERQRLSSLDHIESGQPTKIFGDVLAKLISFAPVLARALGRNPLKVNILAGDIHELPVVYSNRDALITVFRNLVHNAVKYSSRDEGHRSWLHLDAAQEGEGVCVLVSDNGVGIPPDESERVFAEGYRAQNAIAIDPTGAGIGLHDCREIMRLLGGTIEVVSPRDTEFGRASTTIKVWIPIKSARSAAGNGLGPADRVNAPS